MKSHQMIYKMTTFLSSLFLLTHASVATLPSKEGKNPSQKNKKVLENQSFPLITFETITARSGDLLGIPKAKQFQDTLKKAMSSAYKTNPDILSQQFALRAADEDIVQAMSGWRPKVNTTLSTGYGKTYNKGDAVNNRLGSTPKVSDKGSRSAQLQVTQNLYSGGGTVAQIEKVKANIKAQRAALIEVEQTTLYSAIQAYLDLITQLAQLEVLKANEAFLQITLKSTKDKFDIGEETRTSVAQAEAQYAQAISKRQDAEAQLSSKVATYIQIIGREPGRLQKPDVPKDLPKTIKQALDQARLNNPTILKAYHTETSARRKIEETNSGLLPKVDLVGTSSAEKDRTANTKDSNPAISNDTIINHQVTLNLTFPLYEGGAVRSQRRQAVELAEQNRIQIKSALKKIEQQLVSSFSAFETAQKNLKYYKEQVIANEISVEGTRQEMLAGSKILIDVLNAQNNRLNAELSLIQAEETLYLSAYQIKVLTGTLTAAQMKLDGVVYDPIAHYEEVQYKFWE